MPRRIKTRAPGAAAAFEILTRTAATLGQLERLAGIGAGPEERAAFWLPFSRLPGCEGLNAGVRELRARILRRVEAGELGRS